MRIRTACICTFLLLGSCTMTFDAIFPFTTIGSDKKVEEDKSNINIKRNPNEKGAASG